jgi:hypothetical protein
MSPPLTTRLRFNMLGDTYVSLLHLMRCSGLNTNHARWRLSTICTQTYSSVTLVEILTRRDRELFDLRSFFQLHDLNGCVHSI